MRTSHLCIPVAKAWELMSQGKNIWDIPVAEVSYQLNLHTKQGKKYITGCDNEDENGMCAGHQR